MTMNIASLWYLLIGFLLGNGMPHLVFGAAGKLFRTPFGRRSSPRRNVAWGLCNFLLASLLVWWRLDMDAPQPGDLTFLLAGFWLVVLMFGTGIKQFLNDNEEE